MLGAMAAGVDRAAAICAWSKKSISLSDAGALAACVLGVAALPPWMNALAGHGDKFQRAFPGVAERILGI